MTKYKNAFFSAHNAITASYIISEVCAGTTASKKDVGRAFKLIVKTLQTNVGIIRADDYAVRFFDPAFGLLS